MKIAYIITRGDTVGGASVHVRDMAGWMMAQGHEVIVLLGGTGEVTDQLLAAGIPFEPLRHLQRAVDPSTDLRAYFELVRILCDRCPDIVSAHTAKAGWIGRAACRRLRIPVIYTPHGWPLSDRISSVSERLFAAAERIAANWCHAIVCVSEYERQLAIRQRIASPRRLHTIHNGVHEIAPAFRADPTSRPPRLIAVARFDAPKDHKTLLYACGELRDLDWHLDLIGDGPLKPQVHDLAVKLGIHDRVRFAGYQADPAAALANAQIFVLSTRSESFPRSILEAMRAGLPTVASDVGGVSEAVETGCTGIVIPPASVRELGDALKCLINNDLDRQRMGLAAHQKYYRQFRFGIMAEATMALYRDAINKAAPNT